MIAKTIQFFKAQGRNILIFLLIALAVFLAFGAGILTEHYFNKPPLTIETPN